MKVYIRGEGRYEEVEQFGGGLLKQLYGSTTGRMLLKIAISPVVSDVYSFFNSLPTSSRKIPAFIGKYKIDMSDYEDSKYRSFNDFFIRRFKEGARICDTSAGAFISPADSKLLVYDIGSDLRIDIKGRSYSVDELTGDGVVTTGYEGGYALVFRLCMDNCHRYCYVDSGKLKKHYRIKGRLHTVSPISAEYKIYKENTREISVLETDNFDELIYMEVGALLVGRIVNTNKDVFKKGEEKGYFEPGGSTVILLVKGGIIRPDEDILEQSRKGIETQVKYGEKIGSRI